ncbi:HFL070Wp [Eremothecium sinecaudum]|uniref:Kinetochore protein Spc24 n=1 Tax=Eremothecium sinecaudum TaxID=45286 RepID=A0A0X8HUK4_9SACH|nr:HFL070Wp [Eremothecium sinecaudum]AMD21786.1 HFL070Wp [Eremothecium sinecaudum]
MLLQNPKETMPMMDAHELPSDMLEDPASLLRQTRENFSISHDLQLLTATEENLKQITHRTQQLQAKHSQELLSLEKRLADKLKATEAMRSIQLSQSQQLDSLSQSQELVSLSKELELLEQQLAQMHNDLEEGISRLLETSEPSSNLNLGYSSESNKEPQPPGESANVLKLQLYSSLGVILDIDNSQVLIEKDPNSGIDLIPLDDNSISAYYRTKYVWDRI